MSRYAISACGATMSELQIEGGASFNSHTSFSKREKATLLRYKKATPVTGSFQPRLAGLPGVQGRRKILTAIQIFSSCPCIDWHWWMCAVSVGYINHLIPSIVGKRAVIPPLRTAA